MEYKIGSYIPENEILRRFQDEDDVHFVEVRGQEGILYRVEDENCVYYKIDKDMVNEEELELVDDFSDGPPAPFASPGSKGSGASPFFSKTAGDALSSLGDTQESPAFDDALLLSPDGPGASTGDYSGDTGTDTLPHADSQEKKTDPLRELEEGVRIPEILEHLCKKNEYGGYSLRHNKFLYILDSDFCVEVKARDTSMDYGLDSGNADPHETAPPKPAPEPAPLLLTTPVSEPEPAPLLLTTPVSEAEPLVFNKGDLLPRHLWEQCEQDLSSGVNRINIGNFLYYLDIEFRVIARMKVTYSEVSEPHRPAEPAKSPQPAQSASYALGILDGFEPPAAPIPPSGPPPQAQAPVAPQPEKTEPPKKKITLKEAVINLVKVFSEGLDKYNISAGFFKETTLAANNYQNLMRACKGDLSQLNDDTRDATAQGKKTLLEKEGSFNLLKAALVHELYIKSTLTGRGDNMKFFLSHIILAKPNGTVEDFVEDLSFGDKKQIVTFFGERSWNYTDKADIIKRVFRHLRANSFEEFEDIKELGQDVLFKGYMLMKLYQQTTRLDRGDGITMIRLSRDIIAYKGAR